MASNAENVSIWWRHHGYFFFSLLTSLIFEIRFFSLWLISPARCILPGRLVNLTSILNRSAYPIIILVLPLWPSWNHENINLNLYIIMIQRIFAPFMTNCQRDFKKCPWILICVLIRMITMNCLNRLCWHQIQISCSKTVRFKKYEHRLPPWIILRSIKYRDQLFRKLQSIPNGTDLHYIIKLKHFPRYWPFVRGLHRWPVISPHKGQWRGALMFSLSRAWINGSLLSVNLSSYQTILKKTTRMAKCKYYADQFETNKSNIRHTWSTIKEILSKKINVKGFLSYFKLSDGYINDPMAIANHFNKFFANIGPHLSKILHSNSDKSVSFYTKQTIISSFNFECVNSEIVEKIILELSTKNSCGSDGLSTNLLKRIS